MPGKLPRRRLPPRVELLSPLIPACLHLRTGFLFDMRTVVNPTVECCLAIGCMLWLSISTPTVTNAAHMHADEYQQQIAPLFTKYCISCHGGKKPKGDLNLEEFKAGDALAKNVGLMESILTNVKNGEMPPENKPKPT